jgi:hypothetical protein
MLADADRNALPVLLTLLCAAQTDVLAQLKPLLSDASSFTEAELQWLSEQSGRLEYLNGVNHINAEETSAGEKMLNKAMLKFKDNALLYPIDVCITRSQQ